MGAGDIWEPSTRFFCAHKTALKIKVHSQPKKQISIFPSSSKILVFQFTLQKQLKIQKEESIGQSERVTLIRNLLRLNGDHTS